jgi:hypothetical protein
MQKLKSENRVWLSHQVGQEFHRHRPYVAQQTRRDIQETKKALTGFLPTFKKSVRVLDDAEELISAINQAQRCLDDYVSKHSATGKENSNPSADSVLKSLEAIFDQPEMVGMPFDKEQLSNIYAEGRYRFAAAIPPGYKDNNKAEPWCFGDLVVWKQIIDRSRTAQRPAILVTDDTKDDWTYKFDGASDLVPHPILREEFQRETKQEFWLFTTEEFLKQARERLKTPVSDETIEEVRESRESEPTSYSGSLSPRGTNWLESSSALQNLATALGTNSIELPHTKLIEALRLNMQYENSLLKMALGSPIINMQGLGFSNLAANSFLDSMAVGPRMGYSSQPNTPDDVTELDEELAEPEEEEEKHQAPDDEAHTDTSEE